MSNFTDSKMLLPVVDRIVAPKDVQASIPGTCKYITSCGRKDFADVIKLRILRWGDYPRAVNVIMGSL